MHQLLDNSGLAASTRSRRVLVVDDDRDDVERLRQLLGPLGFSLRTATSSAEAVALLAEFPADLALIDVELGHEDGARLLLRLRQQQPAPICVLTTASAALDSAVDAVRCGAADYLQKPFDAAHLVERLQALLEARERALVEQREQRLLLMSSLCAAIAHDVNNSLQVMINEVSEIDLALKVTPPDAARARNGALALERSAQSVVAVCQRIQTFAKGARASQGCDASQVLKSSNALLTKLIGRGVTLTLDVPDAELWVGLGAVQLQQILLNLVLNASQATHESGQVRVELREHAETALYMVSLRVLDDGCGMSEAVLARIFDPYFSTKPKAEGKGFGLSIAHGMVQAIGGEIRVVSQEGHGSCFEVLLPLKERSETAFQPVLRAQRAHRLLIVHDVPTTLRAIDQAFRALGYETIRAGSAEQALRLLDAASEPVDGAISDVRLPGMSGRDLVAALRERLPKLPVILLSDAADVPGSERGASGVVWLGKPFRLAALIERFEAM